MRGRRARQQAASTAAASRQADWLDQFLSGILGPAFRFTSASELAVWIASTALCVGAYYRHGLPVATLYFVATAALSSLDSSLHTLQLLNLAAVVYDLSFELQKLYMLVSNRPLLMVAIMLVALAAEWILERYEAEDSNDERPRSTCTPDSPTRARAARAAHARTRTYIYKHARAARPLHPSSPVPMLVPRRSYRSRAPSALPAFPPPPPPPPPPPLLLLLRRRHLHHLHHPPHRVPQTTSAALGGLARVGRSVGRMLPALMGVLIACVGWLVITAAMLHPSATSIPLVELIEQSLGRAYACVSPSDCVYVAGSHFQERVHGVYVLSPRQCAGKPVYRQRGAEGLFLHSPAHENQWNVGPDPCDNSPRNKWMELYSTAASAAEIAQATWFEYTDELGWTKNGDVTVRPCGASSRQKYGGRACVSMRGSTRDDARYVETPYYSPAGPAGLATLSRPGCGGNGKPVYVSQRIDDDLGIAPYLYSPARRNSWLVGADPCRANGWMEVRSSAEHAEHIQAGASGSWQEYNGTGWVRTPEIRALPPCASADDDCVYISGSAHQQHTHGVYARTALHCDGKPVYMQQTGVSLEEREAAAAATAVLAATAARPASASAAPSAAAAPPAARRRSWTASSISSAAACARRSTAATPTAAAATTGGSTSSRRRGASRGWSAATRASRPAGWRSTRPSNEPRASPACGASTSPAARGRPTRRSSSSSTRCRTPLTASPPTRPAEGCTTPTACSGGSLPS